MKKMILATAGALLAAGTAAAQLSAPLDLEILFTGDDVVANSAASNTEIDGVVVNSAGTRVYYFNSDGSEDGISVWTGGTNFAVVATETELAAGGGSSSGGDMDVDLDTGTLYAKPFAGSNRLWAIPEGGPFPGSEMIDSSLMTGYDEIEFDRKNDRIIGAINDTFDSIPGAEGLFATNAGASGQLAFDATIATEATLEALLATLPGYIGDESDASTSGGRNTNDDIDLYDITIQSDGDIIVSHKFTSNNQLAGTLLRVTEGGTVSEFVSAAQLITWGGGADGTDNIGSVLVEALSLDEILVHVNFVSDNSGAPDAGTMESFIGVVSADGSSFTMIGTESELLGDTDIVAAGTSLIPGGQGLFDGTVPGMDGKGGDVDGSDNYYFYRQGNGLASEDAVFRITGIRALLNSSTVGDWDLY